MDLRELGSQTAINGFKNEDYVVAKFNNWQNDDDAKKWLKKMEYDIKKIEYVKAIKLSGYKTDVQIQVTIKLKEALDVENLQVKLISNTRGYNQIDKRWLDNYDILWNIPEHILNILKRYTGEIIPNIKNPRDSRRMFMDEFSNEEQSSVINWLERHKQLIVSDILKGRGKFAAEWMLVIQKTEVINRWILKPMNFCMNFFSTGDIIITARGNIRIGSITMQRKGGDAGRNTANMLQFKINPIKLFED